MLEELERRNYAPGTIRCYIRTVEHFSRHFRRSPDQLGPEHIRRYQALMFHKWKLAPNTVSQRLAALRFVYIQVLKRNWSIAETPYPKKVLHLPQVLSQQEVARLIDAALTPSQTLLVSAHAYSPCASRDSDHSASRPQARGRLLRTVLACGTLPQYRHTQFITPSAKITRSRSAPLKAHSTGSR
jgi:hypothetical protein